MTSDGGAAAGRAAGVPGILRAATRRALPWKNGGGITREVAAFPPGSGLADFDWRISIAEVRAAGPFSRFPGVDRQMAVLEGRLALSLGAQPARSLASDTPPLFFSGEVPAFGEPLDGPVLDLNVMTRRGRFESVVTRHSLSDTLELEPARGTLLVVALSDLVLQGAGVEAHLVRLDAASLDAGCFDAAPALPRLRAPASCYLIHITPCA